MKKLTALFIIALCLTATAALAGGNGNFGGQGQAWEEETMGDSTYYSHTNQENHNKFWETSEGGKRFTQPGKAEGKADDNSVIEEYPCPGTQVYPGSNAPD